MVDYAEGAEHCRVNSQRLETSARIILKDEDGTDSFGLFLYYLAYEEIAKGIFCLFVSRGWVNEDFVEKVFIDHKTKLFLYDEIFRSFNIADNTACLGDKKLGDKSLQDFISEHKDDITEHRKITNDFLYVDKNNTWKVPQVEIPNIKEEEKKIHSKIEALNIIFEFIKNKYDANTTLVDNFKFFENKDGTFTLRYDAI